ncbi:hypothetical protein BJ085DRAFT_30245 [Dimargaris cristalligena]|uniref:Uncharacterized protein n=1 Tax=Dimargaris cristalligena TaxID=215637 RepID=A0A4V1J5A2_9FUNG|nr:hypothetical protein BJ085DRAFT_30245 [Dimargaris cristalligena]|eukprot:RKP38349.1 hypothetical protein BJ085DRAFT_30245 [Dimargaris cristalligena]
MKRRNGRFIKCPAQPWWVVWGGLFQLLHGGLGGDLGAHTSTAWLTSSLAATTSGTSPEGDTFSPIPPAKTTELANRLVDRGGSAMDLGACHTAPSLVFSGPRSPWSSGLIGLVSP